MTRTRWGIEEPIPWIPLCFAALPVVGCLFAIVVGLCYAR